VDLVLAAPTARIDALCDPARRSTLPELGAAQPAPPSTPPRAGALEPKAAGQPGAGGPKDDAAHRLDYEVILARIWQEVLGVARVEAHQDFFDLGGSSLAAIDVVRRFEALTGRTLELGELFRAPTIAALAASLASDAQPRRLVIPLQPEGDAPPLFCLLGIWIYRDLAEALGPDQPTYGVYVPEEQSLLVADGAEARSMLSIDRLAAAYCDAIREARPEGPYRLAGLSFGGVVAMEVARRLEREGAVVEHVVLLDTVLPTGYRRATWRRVASRMRRLGARALVRLSALVSRTRVTSARWAERGATQHANRRFGEAREREAARWLSSFEPSAVEVTFVRADDRSAWGPGYVFDEDGGWGAVLGRPPTTFSVAGDHVGMMRSDHVRAIGSEVRRTLGRSRKSTSERA
jgi:thioesterase domain-containing protein